MARDDERPARPLPHLVDPGWLRRTWPTRRWCRWRSAPTPSPTTAATSPAPSRCRGWTSCTSPTVGGWSRRPGSSGCSGARGVTADDHLVLYGDEDNVFAFYAYWLLRYYRHPRVSLLDGGRRAWLATGQCLSAEPPVRPERTYTSPGPDEGIRLTRDVLLERYVGAPPGTAVVDCRRPGEFAGRTDSVTGLPLLHSRLTGHVPGAVNVSCTELVDDDGRLPAPQELRRAFAERGVEPERDVVVYCDVGGRGALGWFVLHEVLGYPRVRSYDGGWAEYGSLVGAPVQR